jgi:hypothetical protein
MMRVNLSSSVRTLKITRANFCWYYSMILFYFVLITLRTSDLYGLDDELPARELVHFRVEQMTTFIRQIQHCQRILKRQKAAAGVNV